MISYMISCMSSYWIVIWQDFPVNVKKVRIGIMFDLKELGKKAVIAKYELQKIGTEAKNSALLVIADALIENSHRIIEQN